jgi:hypothetical protein
MPHAGRNCAKLQGSYFFFTSQIFLGSLAQFIEQVGKLSYSSSRTSYGHDMEEEASGRRTSDLFVVPVARLEGAP